MKICAARQIGTISLAAGTGLLLRHVLKARGLEYPRDYKLLVIGGTPQLYTAITTNQIAAVPLSLPFNFAAEELGYNTILEALSRLSQIIS